MCAVTRRQILSCLKINQPNTECSYGEGRTGLGDEMFKRFESKPKTRSKRKHLHRVKTPPASAPHCGQSLSPWHLGQTIPISWGSPDLAPSQEQVRRGLGAAGGAGTSCCGCFAGTFTQTPSFSSDLRHPCKERLHLQALLAPSNPLKQNLIGFKSCPRVCRVVMVLGHSFHQDPLKQTSQV